MVNTLLRILADHLHGRKSEADVTAELLREAKRHEVEGIVYAQTKNPKLERAYYYALYANEQRVFFNNEIHKALEEKDIPHFSVKGLNIAEYYPVPALRTMGDIDLVVQDRDYVRDVLTSMGYSFLPHYEHAEWQFRKDTFKFQLHDRLIYNQRFGTNKEVQFFNNCWNYYNNGNLDWNFHFLFLISHLRKHLMTGVGFRQFYDIAVLVQNAYSLFDWGWIRNQLAYLNLLGFAEVCMGLNQKWFEVKPPFAVPELDESFVLEATLEIYHNGTFGTWDPDTDPGKERELLTSTESSYYKTQAVRFIQKAFPSYEELSQQQQYHFLLERKILLPVAWFYRFIRNVFRIEKWNRFKQNAYISEERFEEKNEKLKRWGL